MGIKWLGLGLREAGALLLDAAYRVTGLGLDRYLERHAGTILAEGIRKCFDLAQDPSGRKWAPRRPPVPQHPPLVETGALQFAAVVAAGHPKAAGGLITVSVGEPFYGVFHQTGTRRMPARPFFGVSDEVMEQLAGLAADAGVEYIVTGGAKP